MRIASEILECLERNGTVITANVRAQRALLRQFSEIRQEQGKKAWLAPAVLDWESWVSQSWGQFHTAEDSKLLILSRLQEQYLWRQIIQRSESGQQLLRHDSMAALAQQAYALLSDYEQHHQRRTPWGADDGDARAFQFWADAFDKECRRNAWLSRSAISAHLAEQLSTQKISGELLLVGFDRLTPAAKRLLGAWSHAGGSWRHLDQKVETVSHSFFSASDFGQELKTCAQWLRSKLENNPKSRLAVVLPDGHGTRGEIERVFRRILAPESLLLDRGHSSALPFEFSLGVPLSQGEEIRAALLLLGWLIRPLDDEELRWLLSTGFLAEKPDEATEISQAYHAHRKRGLNRSEWSLKAFLSEKRLKQSSAIQALLNRLSMMFEEASVHLDGEVQSPLDWVTLTFKLLQTAGWPGTIARSSAHFQVQKKWEQLLDEVSAVGFDGNAMSFPEFLSMLQRQAADTVFAEESRGAPIQIMGPLETSGQTFDGIWFLGAQEQNWPAKTNSHPLIPLWIARPAGIPHATAEVDWELARTATERIAASAPEVIFSYSQRGSDGELRPSPLVKRLFLQPASSLTSIDSVHSDKIDLEPIEDGDLIPFPYDKIAGGADVLKRQAACPFRAFAGIRLAAQALDPTEMGLTALQRGTLLHAILEALWKKFKSQAGLAQEIAQNTLETTVREAVRNVLAENPAAQNKEGWRASYLFAEQQRLQNLVLEWLQFEAGRVPFYDVKVEQEQAHVNVGNLRLRMRIDRLDTIAENRKLLVDYKTGKVSPRSWDGERPEEPQLPLYALFGELGDICGLFFAQIRTGEMEIRGRVEDARTSIHPVLDSKKDIVKKPLTEEMRSQWRAELERLASDFLRGERAVDPKSPIKTCQTCDLPGLCRKVETNVVLLAAESDESEMSDDQNGN